MNLRPYQAQAIVDIERGLNLGHKRQLLMLPTGSGKTATAAELIRQMAEVGGQSVFVVDRVELVRQAAEHLNNLGLRVGVLQADNSNWTPLDDCIVASIQSLRSRGIPVNPRLIVVDEAHILHNAHLELFQQRNLVPVVGLSATPLRMGLGKIFTRMVKGPTIAQLVAQGHLVKTRAFGPNTACVAAAIKSVGLNAGDFVEKQLSEAMQSRELIGDIVSTWKANAQSKPTLVFATDVAHSKAIVDDFHADGVTAAHIDAYTPPDERRTLIENFKAGAIAILSSVNVLAIGFDAPQAQVAILARPTLSTALHIQQVGRVMRPYEGKEYALILDHAGNYARHGPPESFEMHTLNDAEIERSRRVKRTKAKMAPCPSCGLMLESSARECVECGHERRKQNQVSYRAGRLVELGSNARGSSIDRRMFYLELRQIGIDRGQNPKAAAAKFRARFGEWPPWSWNDLPASPPQSETLRWVQSQNIKYAKSKQRLPA
ncbi:MAG: DEAD/DEAH box helicase [Burkholderiaceae bacterium]